MASIRRSFIKSEKFIAIAFVWQLFILGALIGGSGASSCHSVCACKWKGGKQTVECIDRALITIPDDLDTSTQVLDMSGNNLQILPRDTFIRIGLVNLQKVYLRNCRLGQIDGEAFNGLTNLVELDLSNNLITAVPSAILAYIPSLRDLTISGNPIQKIDSHVFKATHTLNKLDLSHCDIQTIAPDAFTGLTSLTLLKLNGNKLNELRPRTIDTLSKLHNVELHDNPWICDCRLRAAKIWLSKNNVAFPVTPICRSGPERVIDRAFVELSEDDFACKPEMMPVDRFVESSTGENATITCRVHAVPSAVVNWYWNGRQLLNGSSFSSYQKVYVLEDGQFEKRSRLILSNAQETDSGEFYCVAENRAGSTEANFTLHVSVRAAGMASLGSSQIVGLSAALVILMLFILATSLFLLFRVRRIPFSESKSPAHLEVITTANPQVTANGKPACNNIYVDTNNVNASNPMSDQKPTAEVKLANPVQKPPRLTDITYSTSHYDGNGSIITAGANLFGSPTASAGNNPDLINDTKRFGSGEFNPFAIDAANLQIPTTSQNCDSIERHGSGEYSRAGCDSLYPSGLWESGANLTQNQQMQLQQHSLAAAAQDLYLKRAAANSAAAAHSQFNGSGNIYSEKMPIIENIHAANFDDDRTNTPPDYLSRTFPRTAIAQHLVSNSNGMQQQQQHHHLQQQQQPQHNSESMMIGSEQNDSVIINNNNNLNNLNSMAVVTSGISTGIATTSSSGNSTVASGYPTDYGLPIVPGAEHHKSREALPPTGISNAKTLRVWQRGGVPVLPPVTALKRALTSSRNSPDEGYQEGCGTDV